MDIKEKEIDEARYNKVFQQDEINILGTDILKSAPYWPPKSNAGFAPTSGLEVIIEKGTKKGDLATDPPYAANLVFEKKAQGWIRFTISTNFPDITFVAAEEGLVFKPSTRNILILAPIVMRNQGRIKGSVPGDLFKEYWLSNNARELYLKYDDDNAAVRRDAYDFGIFVHDPKESGEDRIRYLDPIIVNGRY